MIIIIIAKRKTRSWKRRKENVYLSYLGLFVLPCNLSSQAQPHAFGSPGPTLVHWPIPRVYVCVGIVLWIRLEFFFTELGLWRYGPTAGRYRMWRLAGPWLFCDSFPPLSLFLKKSPNICRLWSMINCIGAPKGLPWSVYPSLGWLSRGRCVSLSLYLFTLGYMHIQPTNMG